MSALSNNPNPEWLSYEEAARIMMGGDIDLDEATFTSNGDYTHSKENGGWNKVHVRVPIPSLNSTTFTANGTYKHGGNGGWDEVTVNVYIPPTSLIPYINGDEDNPILDNKDIETIGPDNIKGIPAEDIFPKEGDFLKLVPGNYAYSDGTHALFINITSRWDSTTGTGGTRRKLYTMHVHGVDETGTNVDKTITWTGTYQKPEEYRDTTYHFSTGAVSSSSSPSGWGMQVTGWPTHYWYNTIAGEEQHAGDNNRTVGPQNGFPFSILNKNNVNNYKLYVI